MNGIYGKIARVQVQLKAPKNLYNSYGGFKYRNFEGICEAVKPLLAEQGLMLLVKDHVEQFGERYYIVADATVYDTETGESVSVQAMAREALTKKGMDDSQITGTASSYARKYALNGLFLIDDTKDADTDEYKEMTSEVYASKKQVTALKNFLESKGIAEKEALAMIKAKNFDKLTVDQYNTLVRYGGKE